MALDPDDADLVPADRPMSSSDAFARWEESTSKLGERSEYKKIWNRQAQDFDTAALAVAGHTDEPTLDLTARGTVDILRRTVGIEPTDLFLEIGCGIGRVAGRLSQECLHWFGTDISGDMLRHAAGRLRDRTNVTLVELSTVGLDEFPDDGLDVVYCTVVFMHLLEWDRYRYVQEAYRVLRPGGRAYFDNVPLDTEHGWSVFLDSARYPFARRPAHISMTSTREELRTYLTKAGFAEIQIHDLANGFIAATGRKPVGPPTAGSSGRSATPIPHGSPVPSGATLT
jgi:SAM-dependent methyltransferase